MEAVEESFAYIASGAEIEKHEFFQWAERLPQQNRTFERLADLDSPKEKLEKELFDGIKTHQADLLRKAERMFSEFESRGGSVGRGVFDDFEETVDALFLRFDEMIAIEKGEVEQSHRSALAIIRTSETAVAAVGIWCVVIAVLVGYFVMRGISRPISDLTVATAKLAEGTWNQPIIFGSKDEIGRLAESFNTMAAQLESAQAELLKKTHLASVGQVASIIGHELPNPLGTIRTSIYSIDNKVPAKELGVERALDRIRRSINRCDNIIGGLLDYTRSLQLEPELIEFYPWLREMLEEYELPPEVRLEQNLCAGVEASPPGHSASGWDCLS